MGWKFANKSTETLTLPSGDTVEVRKEVSKEVFNKLVAFMPEREIKEGDRLTNAEGVRFQEGLFEALVTGWNAPVPAKLDEYRQLDPNDQNTKDLDMALAEHFKSMTPSEDEGKAPTDSPA